MKIDFTPSNENAFGVAILAGRVVGTVKGSDGHITVRATCKAKSEGGRWNTVPFEKATHVFFDVPSADGAWADKIGTFYPAGKWAGHWFDDRSQTDSRRIAAAKYLMRTAAGEIEGAHILKSEKCARCSKDLTHPDSIFAMFGPECIKKVNAFMPNRSGTLEGAHSKKIADHTPELEGMEQAKARAEADREWQDNAGGKNPEPPSYVPPQPSATARERVERPDAVVERVDDSIVATLRRGDDPKVILRALDA